MPTGTVYPRLAHGCCKQRVPAGENAIAILVRFVALNLDKSKHVPRCDASGCPRTTTCSPSRARLPVSEFTATSAHRGVVASDLTRTGVGDYAPSRLAAPYATQAKNTIERRRAHG